MQKFNNINQENELFRTDDEALMGKEELKKKILEGYQLLDELKGFKDSNIGLLFYEELNNEYQRVFGIAVNTDDANIAKASLDRMKGIAFTMNIIENLIKNLDDDIEHFKEELEYIKAGEKE